MRFQQTCLLLLAFAGASIASAGELYGNVFVQGRPLAGGNISVTVGENTVAVETDKRGFYRLPLSAAGPARVQVRHQGRTGSHAFYAFDDSIRLDLILSRSGQAWSVRPR